MKNLCGSWLKYGTSGQKKDMIIAAGVDISENGLKDEWMQQDKFQHAAALLEQSPKKANFQLLP